MVQKEKIKIINSFKQLKYILIVINYHMIEHFFLLVVFVVSSFEVFEFLFFGLTEFFDSEDDEDDLSVFESLKITLFRGSNFNNS